MLFLNKKPLLFAVVLLLISILLAGCGTVTTPSNPYQPVAQPPIGSYNIEVGEIATHFGNFTAPLSEVRLKLQNKDEFIITVRDELVTKGRYTATPFQFELLIANQAEACAICADASVESYRWQFDGTNLILRPAQDECYGWCSILTLHPLTFVK